MAPRPRPPTQSCQPLGQREYQRGAEEERSEDSAFDKRPAKPLPAPDRPLTIVLPDDSTHEQQAQAHDDARPAEVTKDVLVYECGPAADESRPSGAGYALLNVRGERLLRLTRAAWMGRPTRAAATRGTRGVHECASRFDSLNLNVIRSTSYNLNAHKQTGRQLRLNVDRWRPGGRGDLRRGSPVTLRHRLSTALP